MELRWKASLTLLVLVAMFFTIGDVRVIYACTCAHRALAYELFQSDVIFAGLVYSVDWNLSTPITFAVSHVWKGPDTATLSLTTSPSEPSCGFKFQQGEKYLVFANYWKGQLSTGLCSGTKLLSQAQGDIYWLDLTTGILTDLLVLLAVSGAVLLLASVLLIRRWSLRLSKKAP